MWSLCWFFRGCWPTHSPEGVEYTTGVEATRTNTPLAERYSGVPWFIRFDLDFGQCRFTLVAPTAGRNCAVCPARQRNAAPCQWTDARDPSTNGWVNHVYTNATHAELLGNLRHRLVRAAVPSCGISNYVPDLLHAKWLGADQYLLEGVFWLLIAYIMPASIEENLRILVILIKSAYVEEGVNHKGRYPDLKRTQIKTGLATQLPKLKGTGQQCKGLTRVMGSVFRKFHDETDRMHNRIAEALDATKAIDRMYMANRHAYRIPHADSREIIRLSFRVAQITTGLVRHYHDLSAVAFHYTIKLHYCLHATWATRYCNAVYGDCSSGEDFMNTARKLIRGCMYGNGLTACSNVAVQKYLKRFAFRSFTKAPW